jgi:hypothetical protein
MRSERHNEIIQSTAGVVSTHNNGSVRPLVFLGILMGAVFTFLVHRGKSSKNDV